MHCMTDLETLDTSSTALILSIGAVSFDTKGIDSEFYEVIKLDAVAMKLFTISADTLNWWFTQHDAIKAFANGKTSIHDALYNFSEFFNERKCEEHWGNGSDFDNVILANAYSRYGLKAPWRYSKNRCFRTVKAVHPKIDVQFNGVRHNALADARHQAEYLIRLNEAYSLNIL